MKGTHQHLNLPASKLTKKQKKAYTFKDIKTDEYGRVDFYVEIRFDDECGNGHNSFAITGDIVEAGKTKCERNMIACGAIGDSIEKYIPELAHLNKWHSCSTDEPMHYVGNTTYHARTTDHDGKKVGEPVRFDQRLKFSDFPITFSEQEKGFWQYLDEVGDFNNIEVEAIAYDGQDTYDFSPNYSLTGFIKENETKKWRKAPFKDKRKAEEFLACLQQFSYEIISIPVEWCKAVEPNLEAARSSAIWPDATLEQLQDKDQLMARLPELMESFKADIEALGFEY